MTENTILIIASVIVYILSAWRMRVILREFLDFLHEREDGFDLMDLLAIIILMFVPGVNTLGIIAHFLLNIGERWREIGKAINYLTIKLLGYKEK